MAASTLLLLACSLLFTGLASAYFIGAGRYDITGPAAEVEMMGYAMPTQITHGIHFRQWARAFIFADAQKKSRVVFVNIDACMTTQAMKIQVVKRLKAKYGDLYTDDNVLISGTHTHSGPAGYFQYVLFEVMSIGFVNQSLEVTVNGIMEAIRIAHENMKGGSLYTNDGELLDANINRSPTAYKLNPDAGDYTYDVDKGMKVLKMVGTDGSDIGMLDWFAVHGTSMNNTNQLISGDNKGHASFLMEKFMNKEGDLPGQGEFVAAFAQSNEGDVSPNTKGPHCLDTGKPCDILHSTCDGKNELCVAAGPGKDMFDSTRIIGEKQFDLGKTLYKSASKKLTGPVEYRHTFLNMSGLPVTINGTVHHTCKSAMGYAFAAGTTDGPGAFNFEQADTHDNWFWNIVRDFLHKPTDEQVKCHAPKPILLDTGYITFPYPWQPAIVPIQILRIGQLVILGVPAEFTTMSGRRLREDVLRILIEQGKDRGFDNDTEVVIAGLSNTYADYVATYEEYQEQRYEAASTIYGPNTLAAYLQEFKKLAAALATGKTVDPGPSPPDYLSEQLSFHFPVIFDAAPSGDTFGSVHVAPKASYTVNSTVEAQFWAGNPRNNLMTNKTFLTVERKQADGSWLVTQTDASWDTRFHWKHTSELKGESLATVTWDIAPDTPDGTYIIRHFGYHKPFLRDPVPYSGSTNEFHVTG